MARRFILSDDLTGDESPEVANHLFMFDNVFYEVDLSPSSLARLEKAMGPFIKVMRETRRITATAKGEASDAEKRRQWAKANGFEVSERGRLSDEINSAYDKAHDGANRDNPDTDEKVSEESTEASKNGSKENSENDSE